MFCLFLFHFLLELIVQSYKLMRSGHEWITFLHESQSDARFEANDDSDGLQNLLISIINEEQCMRLLI